jgi:hypothetical protein
LTFMSTSPRHGCLPNKRVRFARSQGAGVKLPCDGGHDAKSDDHARKVARGQPARTSAGVRRELRKDSEALEFTVCGWFNGDGLLHPNQSQVTNLADLLGDVTVSPSGASQPENYFGTAPCGKAKARRNGYRAAPFAGSLFACFPA